MWHSLWKYHPRIGYTYIPSVRSRVPFDGGGYLVATNAAGFRSEREFVRERTGNASRAIVFGDSQTAGDGVDNCDRFSDRLERLIPGLEVFNYGLTGTGTDQQYLAYLEYGGVEHDLLIIAVYVENIRRVNHRILEFFDANRREVFYAKPYYQLEDDRLVLHQVPVPKRPWTRETLPADAVPHVDRGAGIFSGVQALLRWAVPHPGLRNAIKTLGMRDFMQKVTRFQPVPEYDRNDHPEWLLLRKILMTWIRGSATPVLLVPIPMWMFIDESSDPTSYRARFRELASDAGCVLHDPLPDFWTFGPQERRAFRFEHDTHLSARGHEALARSMAPVVERLLRERRNAGAPPSSPVRVGAAPE